MKSLLVMIPTRGRPEKCSRVIESFRATVKSDETVLMFITDGDDDSYEGFDWQDAVHGVLSPRDSIVGIWNRTADAHLDAFDALMAVNDDCVFITPGWDEIMLTALEDMGGSGFVYPDLRRRTDVPEMVLISSDVVKALGFFAEPSMGHFYIDNAWGDLGRRSDLLRYCPDAVIEHQHYSLSGAERDATYREAEDTYGAADREAYQRWLAERMPHQVALLRRLFNPDLRWLMGRI